MTASQFTQALATIGWSQRHLASLLGCDTNLPTRWATGRASVPEPLADWLEALAYAHRHHGVPGNWRVRPVTHPVP